MENKIIKEIEWLLAFPEVKICKHLIATRLFAILGNRIPISLISNTFNANDEKALKELQCLDLSISNQ